MKLKRFLIIAPLCLIAVLLQSYFWVPTYESQTTGNPDRVWKFIVASIGDAKILNPILNADTSSSEIVGLVFEGLLDLDEDLNLRGRLATGWSITEEAYLLADPASRFPDGIPVTAALLKSRIESAIASGRIRDVKDRVREIRVLPASARRESISGVGKENKPVPIDVSIRSPARLQFILSAVDQDFFKRLAPVIGIEYGAKFNAERWTDVPDAAQRALVRPHLAELLPVFEHNPVIVFQLRKGTRFHDGHEFDAGDVKFTYEAIMNPKNLSPRTPDFEPIKRVEAVNRDTIRVVYKRLFSPAINAWTMGILPEHLLNAAALTREMDRRGLSEAARARFGMRDSEFNRRPVGVGPFKFVEWQSDELIHLTRNDGYWERPPQFRDYYYRIIPDPLTQEVEFRTGAIDTYAPQPHQVARYRENDKYQAYSSLGFSYSYIGYNNRNELFADRRVRTALGMAINVDEIIKYVLYGEGANITGPFPKNTEWYDQSVKPLPYDPEGALAILRQLGWKKNSDGWLVKDGRIFEFNLITNNGNPVRKAIMTIAQNNWRKIGIKCNTQLFEWAVFLQDFINVGKFDAVILGWSMGVDPDLFQIWHSSQSGPQQLNFVAYKSDAADALIVRIRREYDRAEQRRLTHRLHQLIARDQPYTFLYVGLGTRVLDKKIAMVQDDGTFAKIQPTKTGNIFFHFNRWRKLEYTPTF